MWEQIVTLRIARFINLGISLVCLSSLPSYRGAYYSSECSLLKVYQLNITDYESIPDTDNRSAVILYSR